jgi:restriction endonuclease S subunit
LKTQLKFIVSIQTGLFTKPTYSGDVVYLQAKHFDSSGTLKDDLIPELSLSKNMEKHILNDGDVIFAAKGSKNFAAHYETKNGHCVASSTFFVIRLKDEFKKAIKPEYLVWFFNHPKAQEYLKSKARGSSMPSISKLDLMELEILIPPIDKQTAVLKVDSLQKKEASIMKQIKQLKEKYIQNYLFKAITK